MAEISSLCSVCVTGGSGFVASSLIGKLLLNGHTVHATLRNLEDESKAGLLKKLPNATTHLKLFKADLYEADAFEDAIRGCQIVFHVATPLHHTPQSKYENRTEASVAAAKTIAELCVKLRTVRRLIYTASVLSASPMEDGGGDFKNVMDESCWTQLHLSYPFSSSSFEGYVDSKTKTEKELLRFGESEDSGGLEVVSLACGLIVGDTLHSSMAETTIVTFSQFTNQVLFFNALRFIEEVDGKVPLVHLHDVCDAHIFCMEQSSIHGRFLCANSFLSSPEITNYYHHHHPQLLQKQGNSDEVPIRNVKMNFSKLIERGFIYKYDGDMILEDAFQCYKKKGDPCVLAM